MKEGDLSMPEQYQTELEKRRQMIEQQTEDMRKTSWERRLQLANIPPRFWEVSSDLIPDALPYKAKIMNWHRYYFQTAVENHDAAVGMYLFGPPGSGKTSILAGTTMGLIRSRIGTYFYEAKNLITEMSSPTLMYPNVSDLTVIQHLGQVRVLNLDDIYRVGENRFGDMTLDAVEQLLRDRWGRGLTTNISCNLSLEQLAERNARISNVIEEMTQPVEVSGLNIRKTVAKARKDVF